MAIEVRNFCIIAHIDHGKSTLADRFLELTGTVSKRVMQAQFLDQMDLERERGITIKLQPVTMNWRGYQLNLIDTPGHVDFSYEVSRSLACVEGAILLVDATQGVQAQTIANLELAQAAGLVIVPVVNKIDLPAADPTAAAEELGQLLGVAPAEVLHISAKSGAGVATVLEAVITHVPGPSTGELLSARALIFDSHYDDYRGVVAAVRVRDGTLKAGQAYQLLGTRASGTLLEVGRFSPKLVPTENLTAGAIGYMVTGLKDIRQVRVGDTLAAAKATSIALPGYREVRPMVFAGFYPAAGQEIESLREALMKLSLNDASLVYEGEHSPALGYGFRCGF
ncbi:MAG: GTP-binding protein, partial [Candidatus Veblenbacteria bacterium]|nr:GTP-binding protein [Candidatus Veblenbacteria bacterium]